MVQAGRAVIVVGEGAHRLSVYVTGTGNQRAQAVRGVVPAEIVGGSGQPSIVVQVPEAALREALGKLGDAGK